MAKLIITSANIIELIHKSSDTIYETSRNKIRRKTQTYNIMYNIHLYIHKMTQFINIPHFYALLENMKTTLITAEQNGNDKNEKNYLFLVRNS